MQGAPDRDESGQDLLRGSASTTPTRLPGTPSPQTMTDHDATHPSVWIATERSPRADGGAPGSLVGNTSIDDRRARADMTSLRRRLAHDADQILLAADGEPTALNPVAGLGMFFGGWVLVGLLLAHVLIRRGHDTRLMVALGVGLGPLLVAMVIESDAGQRHLLVREGVDGTGSADLLIVLHWEADSIDELEPTLRSLDGVLRRTTIVTTVPYESCDPHHVDDTLRAATARLLADRARNDADRPVPRRARRSPHGCSATLRRGGARRLDAARRCERADTLIVRSRPAMPIAVTRRRHRRGQGRRWRSRHAPRSRR